MYRYILPIAAALLSVSPAMAQTFRAENRVMVTPVTDGFVITSGGDHGAMGMWCAAADYARKVLGAAGTDRIYISQGRNPGLGQRGPVRFSMDGSGLRSKPVVVVGASLSEPGSNLSVDHAYQFCTSARLPSR